MRSSFAIASVLVLAVPALADEPSRIEIRRGEDRLVYGSCVPSLLAENRSMETIDYLEVDLLFTLAGGAERRIELKSAYREGILWPIAPGKTSRLQQHLDTSASLGVACDQVKDRKVLGVLCVLEGGAACNAAVSVAP